MGWGAIAGAVGGITSSGLDFYSNHRNRQIAKDVLEYEKWAQQQTWDREDTAHQRAVADLKAAGLSPVLAAGSASPTSSPIKPDIPKWEPLGNSLRAGISTAMDLVGGMASLEQKMAEISKTKAEEDYIHLQNQRGQVGLQLETQILPHKLRLALADALYREGSISKQDLERTIMEHDYDWSRDWNIRYRDSAGNPLTLGSGIIRTGGQTGTWLIESLGSLLQRSGGLSPALQLAGEKVGKMMEGIFNAIEKDYKKSILNPSEGSPYRNPENYMYFR